MSLHLCYGTVTGDVTGCPDDVDVGCPDGVDVGWALGVAGGGDGGFGESQYPEGTVPKAKTSV